MSEQEYQNQNRITFIVFLILLFFIVYLFLKREEHTPVIDKEIIIQEQNTNIDSNPFQVVSKEENGIIVTEIIEEFDTEPPILEQPKPFVEGVTEIKYVNFDFQNSHIDDYFLSSFRNPSDFNNGVYLANDFFKLYNQAGLNENYVFSGDIVDSFGNVIHFADCSTEVTNRSDDAPQKKWINCENKDSSEKLNVILNVFKDSDEDIRDYEILYIYEYVIHENEDFPLVDTQIALFPMNDNNGVVFSESSEF